MMMWKRKCHRVLPNLMVSEIIWYCMDALRILYV